MTIAYPEFISPFFGDTPGTGASDSFLIISGILDGAGGEDGGDCITNGGWGGFGVGGGLGGGFDKGG